MAYILLVDDEDSIRELFRQALELDGHTVETGIDGNDGLDILHSREGAFDLMLSDIFMPGMDGIALAHEAKRAFPELRIVLMTGFAGQRERAKELEEVVIDVLSKPFSIGVLRETVRRVVNLPATPASAAILP
ncbi:MAG: response regulator [Methylobacteriaceae bacterium]|jgi:DNA-binding NtrC family response regulator|nr:response regulator [Methylobacteriaceae bacterium]